MDRVFLISSAAYVEPELIAEFGRLPPAFLPLGNQRLFVHQSAALGAIDGRLLLSLPEDFELDAADRRQLAELRIEILAVPPGLTLGQSLVYVVNIAAIAGHGFTVLHGDTILHGLDTAATDVVSVSPTVPPGYPWGYISVRDGIVLPAAAGADTNAVALTGYFAFSDASLLVQSVTRANGDFLVGLTAYSGVKPLRPVTAERWLDFGHASTYHASRQSVTTERGFNKLVARRRALTKSGSNHRKIDAEARWFESLPPPLRVFTPAFLGLTRKGDNVSYELEYLHLPTLSDLFVFGRLPERTWDRIFDACDEFLSACAAYRPDAGQEPYDNLYLNKTLHRLEQFARAANIGLADPCRFEGTQLPSLEQMARIAAAAIPAEGPEKAMLVHGDFCFSNIMYDFRAQQIRVIDPRGLDARDRFTSFGDTRYDIGKLYHSAVGMYDFIVAGRYAAERLGPLDLTLTLPENTHVSMVRERFEAHRFEGVTPSGAAAQPIAVLLFLSMLPLHADDPQRQTALLANGMRLFRAFDRSA